MRLRSSKRGTIGLVANSVLLCWDYDRGPDRYRANSIDTNYNNNNDINVIANDDTNNENENINLGDGSVFRIFRCGSKRCKF